MKTISLLGIGSLATLFIACSTSSTVHEHTRFSKADSLTDAYLVLNDSVLQSWNRIVGNEIDKSRTLQEVIEDLDNANLLSEEVRESFQVRMDQLEKIRFTQQTIVDPQVVEDYDAALQSLIDDISKIAATAAATDTNKMFRYLQENSFINRTSYDSLARTFNNFIEQNRSTLKDFTTNNELQEKPLFVKVK
jgi:hypothetical protein